MLTRLKEEVRRRIRELTGVNDVLELLRAIEPRLPESSARSPDGSPPLCVAADGDPLALTGFDYPYAATTREWSNSPFVRRLMLDLRRSENDFAELLRQFLRYKDRFLQIPVSQPIEPGAPHWVNGWFPGLDAVALYAFVAMKNPPLFLEVGSGNSTSFARKAVSDFGLRTRIVSIDPQPRKEIDAICDEVIRRPLEQVDLKLFERLTSDDLLFIDSSHRSFPGSDVTVFFTEILGALPPGLLYGLHDVFLPRDYWGTFLPRFYNEQYLLLAYLAGGADGDTIVLPANYVSHTEHLKRELDPIWNHERLRGIEPFGGAFWLCRSGCEAPGPSPSPG